MNVIPFGRVLCVGVAVLDNLFRIDQLPGEPTKVFAKDFAQVGGGPGANAAVTVARLGGRAALWARVGDDPVGAGIINELHGYGVDVSSIRQVPNRRTGVSAVLVDNNGERCIFAFADRTLDTDTSWLPAEVPSDTDAILCDVRWPAASERVMREASARGIPTVLDADLTDDDSVRRLIGFATHAVFSAPALRRLAGTDDLEDALRHAQTLSNGSVSVTRGAEGFSWLEAGQFRTVPAFAVNVVDTLAAGDVFHGAFALALAERQSIAEAARFAGATAAIKCTRWGGRAGIPTRDEIHRLMAEAA